MLILSIAHTMRLVEAALRSMHYQEHEIYNAVLIQPIKAHTLLLLIADCFRLVPNCHSSDIVKTTNAMATANHPPAGLAAFLLCHD